ncbi:hypothetical protein [Burkholderia sp. 8Y]|uniref:hypothetical protein n=1 Tax=Burkholderia sp. 8Y TaxID=2653133 RepID=UPI00135C1D7D|nr:hypothetical protein [Burkholderia sp. 8Y]
MKRAERRRHVAAGIVVVACATVGGCNSKDDTAVDRTAAASARASTQDPRPAAAGTSELENWAISATSTDAPRPPPAASAQATSDALALPVIHTVD